MNYKSYKMSVPYATDVGLFIYGTGIFIFVGLMLGLLRFLKPKLWFYASTDTKLTPTI